MKCSGCGAEIDDTRAFPGTELACGACGVKTVAGAAPAAKSAALYRSAAVRSGELPGETSRRCPRCGVGLSVPTDDEPRGRCSKCSGAFVDHAAIRRMLTDADAKRSGVKFRRRQRFDPDVRSFQCPVCREPMERNPFGATSGIYLDACEPHGIWFDARELDDALEYVRAVGLEEARAPLPAPPPIRIDPPVAAPTHAAPRAGDSIDAIKLKAALDASLAYEMLKEKRDAERLAGGARSGQSTNLIGFVFRMLR